MILLFIVLILLTVLFWLAYHITGAILKACFWLFVRLPITLITWVLAVACCCTLILIPVGLWLFKLGGKILIPG
ncbi:MAG: hypothetical protein Q4D51_01550 [Eubacteriales bacterium]|nr:hypothetical protein [Eubacteriales bacterium]